MGTLSLSAISKRYGKRTVIDALSYDVPEGVTIMTGRSGAGKSTLLRLLATLEKPSSGTITHDGVNIFKSLKPYRRQLGYAPQAITWPDTLTGLEFLTHIGALKHIRRSDALAQGQALLDRVGLGADGHRRIQTYSGGMRRRLGLTQALLGTPKVLLLDEPAAELDSQTSDEIHTLIFETAAQGATVIMTTHREDAIGGRPVNRLVIG